MTSTESVPTTPMQDAQIIARAGEIMAERGRTRSLLFRDDGTVCLVGALNLAAAEVLGLQLTRFELSNYELPGARGARKFVGRRARDVMADLGYGVIHDDISVCWRYNDHVCEGDDEAQHLLKFAAEDALIVAESAS